MKIAIILNESRVTPALKEQLDSPMLTEKYNITYDLFLTKPDQMENLINSLNHQTYNGYIIGGGDGTVRTAAQALIDQNIPIAILPLGTFNLLAKTLNYPNDIDAIFSFIKNNKTKKIDLVEVNDKVMINHAWIGFYYYILKMREKHKDTLSKSKIFKILFNTLNLFKALPFYQLDVKTANEIRKYETCLIFISNNESYTGFLDFGEHKSLTAGLLSVIILNCSNRWELFLCMLDFIIKDPKKSKYVTYFFAENLSIMAKSKQINMVLDGELFKVETPIKFSMRQKQLTVFIP